MSWLSEWLEARGIDYDAALKRAPCSRKLWDILWNGGYTIPRIALQVGREFGMKPQEVRNIGKALNAEVWLYTDRQMREDKHMLADVASDWYTLLDGKRIRWARLRPWQDYVSEKALKRIKLADETNPTFNF